MTATEELRRMLDERGVEWMDGSYAQLWCTVWHGQDGKQWRMTENMSGMLTELEAWQVTPEQAIAATLGSCSRSSNCTNGERTNGTCRDVRSADHIIAFECSECGCWVAYDEYWETGIYVPDETGQEHIHPRYCPNCGAKVVS